jgi:hypothetical protein
MQNAADHTLVQSDNRNDSYGSIVSNLGSLVEQVRANMNLIETAIASEAALGDPQATASLVVLDDVTPRYVQAKAALNASHVGLGLALHLLQEIRSSKRETGEGQPIGLPRCA